MNIREATKLDTDYYADYDDESGLFCVFGDLSDFAYSSHASIEDAWAACKERRETRKSKI